MMKIIIKILSITLVAFLFNPQLFADIYEVNNNKIIILMESGVPLIDIRTKREWYETGVIKKSNLLTFFDKDGNYNVKEWMSKLKKIASNKDPVIIICRSGRRSRIVANFLDQKEHYTTVFHATDGIISWIDFKNKTDVTD